MANAFFSVGILLPENLDSHEQKMLLDIKTKVEQFDAMLADLDWYVFDVAYLSGSFEMNKQMYIEITKKYMKEAKYHLNHDRIWDIIKANDYNIFDKHREIVSKYLKDVLKVLNSDNIQKNITNLIDYEQNKILS